ncbi:MAG: hypothetical protein ACI8RZ_001429 [Myxococcota bacterium]|jgi:hypothetical protein
MLTLLLLACSGEALDPSGIWMLQIAASTGGDCDTLLSHNLLDAAQPIVETASESTVTASDMVVMARLVSSEGGLLLMLEDGVYPEDPERDWATFTWTRSETDSRTDSHAAGYALTVSTEQSLTQSVTLDLPRKVRDSALVVDGAWIESTSLRRYWEESDTWPDEVGVGATGAMPASSYLEVPSLDTGGGTVPASNTQWEADCQADPCTLSVLDTCTDSRPLTATLTDLDPQEEGWQDAGWSTGL